MAENDALFFFVSTRRVDQEGEACIHDILVAYTSTKILCWEALSACGLPGLL